VQSFNRKEYQLENNQSNENQEVTAVIRLILDQYRQNKIEHDLEVYSEILLIAKVLHNRLDGAKGKKMKNSTYIELEKKKIIDTVSKDEYYLEIKEFLKNHSKLNNKLN
tara:strand:+ start:439 stop:765 length:327 start_codon:yes stop_codon:yes gene_type:complete